MAIYDSLKLIVMTDPHLVKPGKSLYGLDPAERLEICVTDIANNHADADLCVVMGDLTEYGDPDAYQLLKGSLESLKSPYRLLVGNHDIRSAFRKIFPEVPADDNGYIQSALDLGGCRFLFLDTLKEGTHEGDYSGQQQAWLRAQLETARDKSVYLFMHHPPLNVGIPSLDSIALRQQAQFKDLIRTHIPQLKHIFFGHLHRPVSGSWQGVPFTCVPSLVYQCGLDFEENDQPPGTLEAPAYAIVLIENGNTVVHFHNFLDSGPNFRLRPRPE